MSLIEEKNANHRRLINNIRLKVFDSEWIVVELKKETASMDVLITVGEFI